MSTDEPSPVPGRTGHGVRRILTEQGLPLLLAALHRDPREAPREYLNLRARLLRFFRWRGCVRGDELADETIFRVAARLGEGQALDAGCLCGYCYAVARNVLHEYWVQARKDGRRSIDDLDGSVALSTDPIVAAQTEAEMCQKERMMELLDRCLQRLPCTTRSLIMEYYAGRGPDKIGTREKLAQRLGVSVNALRLRVLRIRDCLRRCVERERAA